MGSIGKCGADKFNNCQKMPCRCTPFWIYLNSNHCAKGAFMDQLYNDGILACLKWSHTKNPHMTTYKIQAWQINSGETISFTGTRINFQEGDKKNYGQSKNLWAAAKMFGHLYNVSGLTK